MKMEIGNIRAKIIIAGVWLFLWLGFKSGAEKLFKNGWFRTQLGFSARVLKVETIKGRWLLRGFIKFDGVFYLHLWSIEGKSMSGDTKYDLTSS